MPASVEDVPTFADAPTDDIGILPVPGHTELARRSGPRMRSELIATGLDFAADAAPRGTT